MVHEWRRDDYVISTDAARLDLRMMHEFLSASYWSPGIPRAIIEQAIQHSLNFGLYYEGRQIGFARVISDYATFAYVCDVFVLDAFQGRGLGTWLMEIVTAHPNLQGLRRWILATRDAHGLYRKVGFTTLSQPDRFMERVGARHYRRGSR
jgi:GNAT superfamily N-acetyltransferase